MNTKLFRIQLLSYLLIFLPVSIFCQPVDSSSFKINSRLSFYSFEKNGELLIHVPSALSNNNLSINIKVGEETIASWYGKPGRNILRLPFSLNLAPSVYNIEARIAVTARPGVIYLATTNLIVLSHKPNEVKTDRLTGGLIVSRRQFFPFGFYCYSPVYPTLPEEEIVKGFNIMSPYQKIIPETLNERKAYMDRCAELGMKVNYNLLSVSGGGGVSSKIEGLSDEEKRDRLIAEIKTFMDHPALLGWYIADEPTANNISPDQLEEIYQIVKENDPWHPVSIVFMAPYLSSGIYINSLDIVMADPYPIPDSPVTMVGDVAGQLHAEFKGKKPVWIVPQAFGGGEWWGREPTIQEIRSMTWQSIIKGATGIQYFVRQGLNYFPKSAATWSVCGRMAMEVAELTPWLLSDEETLPVESYSKNIIVSSRLHNGQLIVMAVNKINEPAGAVIRIKGVNNAIGRLLFENRSVAVTGGLITDYLAPFGSQVYLIDIKSEKPVLTISNTNLIKDPGFEDVTSPGVPSACYARPGGDRGATYFLDTREHYEGNHSVRIITPEDDKSVSLRFFPFSVKAGASYTISIWAKSDPEQRFFMLPYNEDVRLNGKKQMPQYVEILLGEFGRARFVPDKEWRRFVTFVTIPVDTLASFKTNLILKMPGQGVAWFDEVKVFEEKSE
ncbi:MAG: hypothetical protein NT144_14445 [Bacteroidia bacterium]|nr:hypothetical protein [Bacteroidia bacterium]